jgi:hypothetical protein
VNRTLVRVYSAGILVVFAACGTKAGHGGSVFSGADGGTESVDSSAIVNDSSCGCGPVDAELLGDVAEPDDGFVGDAATDRPDTGLEAGMADGTIPDAALE